MKKSIETNKALCPVCGKAHVDEYDICEVCNWGKMTRFSSSIPI